MIFLVFCVFRTVTIYYTYMFTTYLVAPLFNLLVWMTHIFSGHIGISIIIITVLIKVVLWPLALKAARAQAKQKELAPKMAEIKKNYPDTKEQGQKIMELYRETGSNPFSGCLPLLIQIPILIAIYQVFLQKFTIDNPLLYAGNTIGTVHMTFLGINLATASIILAILAGITQWIQIRYSPLTTRPTPDQSSIELDAQTTMMNSMNSSMQWTMPIMIGVFSYITPGALALYWVVTNITTIVQDRIIKHKLGL